MDDALTKRCVIALIFIKRLNDLFYDDKTELVIGMPLSFGSRIDGVRPYSIDDVVKVASEIRITILGGSSRIKRVIVVEIGFRISVCRIISARRIENYTRVRTLIKALYDDIPVTHDIDVALINTKDFQCVHGLPDADRS